MKIEYYIKNKEEEVFEVVHIPDYNPLSFKDFKTNIIFKDITL